MNIQYNKNFEKHIDIASIKQWNIERYARLKKYLDSPIMNLDGCYFIHDKGDVPKRCMWRSEWHPDRTGYEVSENRFRPIDYLKRRQRKDVQHCSVAAAFYLAKRLEKLEGSFVVSMQFGLEYWEEDNDFESSITFHKKREGEVIYDEDLNEYLLEGILHIST